MNNWQAIPIGRHFCVERRFDGRVETLKNDAGNPKMFRSGAYARVTASKLNAAAHAVRAIKEKT